MSDKDKKEFKKTLEKNLANVFELKPEALDAAKYGLSASLSKHNKAISMEAIQSARKALDSLERSIFEKIKLAVVNYETVLGFRPNTIFLGKLEMRAFKFAYVDFACFVQTDLQKEVFGENMTFEGVKVLEVNKESLISAAFSIDSVKK